MGAIRHNSPNPTKSRRYGENAPKDLERHDTLRWEQPPQAIRPDARKNIRKTAQNWSLEEETKGKRLTGEWQQPVPKENNAI